MGLPRGSAQVDTDVTLGILFKSDGLAADPYEVSQVEIIDTDGVSVLETITSGSISHVVSSGEYYVDADGSNLDSIGLYYDKWYYTWENGGSQETTTQDFYVQDSVVVPPGYGTGILTGSQIKSEVASNLRRSDLSSRITLWLQMAVTEIYHAVRFRGLKSKASFTTTASTDTYAIGDITDDSGYYIHDIVQIELDNDGDTHPITILDMPYMVDHYRNSTENEGLPRTCYKWGWDLVLRPIPDDEYTINLHTLYIPPTVGDSDRCVLPGLDAALIALTTSLGYKALGEINDAISWRAEYEHNLARVKSGQTPTMTYQLEPFGVRRTSRFADPRTDPWYWTSKRS